MNPPCNGIFSTRFAGKEAFNLIGCFLRKNDTRGCSEILPNSVENDGKKPLAWGGTFRYTLDMKTRSHSHRWGQFGRLCLEPRILAVVLCVVVMAPFAGTQAFSTSTIGANEERHASRQSELRQRLLRERREAASRRQGMGAFQDKKGVTILTNRPEKYRNRVGYDEITLDYEMIVIPDRYRNRVTPEEYSTSDIGELVQRYARQYNVDEGLIYAIIKVESNGNPKAVSPKGARGLMQLMPQTAEDMGVKNIHDPAENIAGGTQYFAKLLELFDNDPVSALAGYNAGPENVKKWGGVPPFEETQNYVKNVLKLSQRYSKTGVDASYLSRSFLKTGLPAAKETKQVAVVRKEEPKQKFQVRFKSGTIQQAEKVVEEGDYYYMDYKGRSFRVRKGLVETVTPQPLSREASSRVPSQM